MTNHAQELESILQDNLSTTLFGLETIIHDLCIALIAKGQVLLEGVPGLGKTLLAKSLAQQLQGDFKRIQCTADMMPSDMTGIHVYNSDSHQFELLPGPLFADVVLVDEINRTGPKTQSALLQAMEERCISIDRDTYPLPDDFFIIAAQNPHEFEGTYPLPESQLDRFLLCLRMQYPSASTEISILKTYNQPGGGHVSSNAENSIKKLPENSLHQARDSVQTVNVADSVYQYVQSIAHASRMHSDISLGLSSRGALALIRCARVEAALRGGEYVIPDDVKMVASAVMAHRMILTPEAMLEGLNGIGITKTILEQVEIPRDQIQ
ncbi:MAG: MoxR family ATPase [Methylococcales bacterium]|jgi:MoxR-like ATPase|nr:MoxR family ATPase [Methylococcales bacterium]